MKSASKFILPTLLLCLIFLGGTSAQSKRNTKPNPPQQMEKLATPHTEEFTVNAPIEQVYDWVVAEDVLPKILKKYFIIPAVKGSQILKGNWRTPGSYRTVFFANGDTLREELTDFTRPTYFAYKISDISGFQKHFISYGVGQWWFKSVENKTEIKWTYTFYAKSRFKRLFLKPFVNHDFKTYMKRSIKLIKEQIEDEYKTTQGKRNEFTVS